MPHGSRVQIHVVVSNVTIPFRASKSPDGSQACDDRHGMIKYGTECNALEPFYLSCCLQVVGGVP